MATKYTGIFARAPAGLHIREGMNVQQRAAKWLQALIYSAAAVGGVWLAVRFLLPWTAPFLLAFSVAALLEIPVRSLIRHGWKRSAASAVLTLAVLGLLIYLAVELTVKGVEAATGFAGEVPALMQSLGQNLRVFEGRVFEYISSAPEGVAEYLRVALDSVGDSFYELPGVLSQWALDLVGRAAQSTPDTLLFIVTAGIGTYFISASFPRITAFVAAQLPDGFRARLEGVGQNLKASFGGFIRAQLILMLMTFFELLLFFLLLRVKGAVGIAAVTALIDALPVFGTGVVLVPWGLYSVLLGDIRRGVMLLVCWGTVNLVRSCTQAKLLGDQIGLDPIASLLAIYVGWRVWGVWGMLLFPILFVTLQQLNDRGVIHLWKSE